jgi:hypothetical protein
VLSYRDKNSVPPRALIGGKKYFQSAPLPPVPPRFPGIFPTIRGSGASFSRRSFQHAIALVSCLLDFCIRSSFFKMRLFTNSLLLVSQAISKSDSQSTQR